MNGMEFFESLESRRFFADTAAVLAAIRTLSDQPIRFVINTTGDADHVGGNDGLEKAGRSFGRGGPSILGQEELPTRMSAPPGQPSLFPDAAFPTETFTHKKSMYLNGEGIQITHEPAAHSDSDGMSAWDAASLSTPTMPVGPS